MKHSQNNNRRQRSRGNPRRYPNQKGGSFDSNGPEAKVRGTAQQVLEKYQALARDAYSAGDRILAEGYLQHAEHYYRILNLESEGAGRDGNRNRQSQGNRDEDMNRDDNDDDENQTEESSAQENHRPSKDDDEVNGLQRTVSRGRNDSRSRPVEIASGGDVGEGSAKAAPDESVAEAPRKPRTRRPRKTEQPVVVDNTDQSAAD